MAVNLNVLGSLVEKRIVGNLNSTIIVRIKRSGTKDRNTKLPKKSPKPDSASAEDMETIVFFLHFQEKREVPRNIHQLAVELLVFGHPAQLASA